MDYFDFFSRESALWCKLHKLTEKWILLKIIGF